MDKKITKMSWYLLFKCILYRQNIIINEIFVYTAKRYSNWRGKIPAILSHVLRMMNSTHNLPWCYSQMMSSLKPTTARSLTCFASLISSVCKSLVLVKISDRTILNKYVKMKIYGCIEKKWIHTLLQLLQFLQLVWYLLCILILLYFIFRCWVSSKT